MHGRFLDHSAAQLRRAGRRFALTVVAVFTVAGLAWVFLTDYLLYAVTQDRAVVARFETAKGWAFVLLTAALLYPVLRRSSSRLTRAQAATFSAVVDSIADGVLILGPERTVVYANPAALRMLGCRDAADLIGTGAEDFSRRFRVSYKDGSLVPPDELISQRVFDEPGPLHKKEIVHPPGGSEVIISATAAAVRMEEGEPVRRVVSVMYDITEAEHLDDLRNQFFAAAAHCLKSPVAIIKASAQSLSLSAGTQHARLLSTIGRQCSRIDRLVDNLLLLARLRSGTLRFYPEPVELGRLVSDVVHEMSAVSRHHDVGTDVRARPSVQVDPERLAVALRNLIDGALRASEAGSPVIVRLTEHGKDAEIGVRYLARREEEEDASSAFVEHDDLGISRHVTLAVVRALGGDLREEKSGTETTAWLRLPVIEVRHALG
jgi:signal transduction histidine kinase